MSTSATTGLHASFRLTFAREYHVGAGHGTGSEVDSALFLDDSTTGSGQAEPAIRYAHGILKQAVFDLLTSSDLFKSHRKCARSGAGAGADRDCDGRAAPPCPVCRIFGTPGRRSRWSFSTIRVEKGVGSDGLRSTRIVRRAAMDLERRRAEDAKLFNEEVGSTARFTFDATGERNDASTEAELALLLAAAAGVRGAGRGRHRGRGECGIEMKDGPEKERLWQVFRTVWIDGRGAGAEDATEAKAPETTRLPLREWPGTATDGEWTSLRLVARLEEPVIAGSRMLMGNVLESEDFIPGGLLLGALASRALRCGVDADGSDFLRAFRGGGARFPDLHPVEPFESSYRLLLPAPRDLLTCPVHPGTGDQGGHGVWSLLAGPEDGGIVRTCPLCDEQGLTVKLRPMRGYLSAGSAAPEIVPALREETKTQVDPYSGRVEESSLYHRLMIPTGTLLAGTLRVQADVLDWLQDDRNGAALREGEVTELRVGKRSGRGYGKIRLACEAEPAADPDAARTRIRGFVKEGWLPLVLTSRGVLRDGFGRSAQSLSPEMFCLTGVDAARCSVGWTEVGGFWRHIGLPRRKELALLPGSVLHLRWNDSTTLDQRIRIVDRLVELDAGAAVGTHAGEGFGGVAVAPFPYDSLVNLSRNGEVGVVDGRWEMQSLPRALKEGGAGYWATPDREPELRARFMAEFENGETRRFAPEFRSVARLLVALSEESPEKIVSRIEGEDNPLMAAIGAANNAARGERRYLERDGAAAWKVVKHELETIGEGSADRATAIRALADAVAEIAGDEDGTDSRGRGE